MGRLLGSYLFEGSWDLDGYWEVVGVTLLVIEGEADGDSTTLVFSTITSIPDSSAIVLAISPPLSFRLLIRSPGCRMSSASSTVTSWTILRRKVTESTPEFSAVVLLKVFLTMAQFSELCSTPTADPGGHAASKPLITASSMHVAQHVPWRPLSAYVSTRIFSVTGNAVGVKDG